MKTSDLLFKKLTLSVVILLIFTSNIFSQYYNGIQTSSSVFIADLQNRIRNPYTRISYDNYDETNIANFASINNGNGTRSVFCVYTGFEYIYTGTFSWGLMSREHTFAHSWTPTFPSASTDQYSDQHHLFPTHQNNANGRRSNHPFGDVVNVTYQFLEGKLGTNASGQIVYEPMDNQKGDVARALYYMCLRYDGIGGNSWNFNWLNNTSLPSLSEAPQDTTVLLNWHRQDPPDKWEIDRNNYIQSIQQNRNPFVDHPEFINYISLYNLTKMNPVYAAEPSRHPTAFTSSANGTGIQGNWNDATGAQLPSGYLIIAFSRNNYFLPIDGSVYTNDSVLSDGYAVMNIPYADANTFNFNNLIQNTTYYFTMYSYNGSGNQINYKIDSTLTQTNAYVPSVLAAEPSNHVTNFVTGNITTNSVPLTWTDAVAGSQVPLGYLILANTNNSFYIPSDGTQYINDTNLSDGNAQVNINYAAPDSYSFNSLYTNTNYYFKIISYNGTGSMINYKTDGSIPFVTGATSGSSPVTGSVLLDNFNRANNNLLGNTLSPDVLLWQEAETLNPSSIALNNNRTKLKSTTAGREYAYVDIGSIAGYPVQFNSASGQLVWAINFRQSRTDPSGFDANNYGAAFILGKTTTDITTGNGYAVVIGNSGSTDAIRLAKFTGGVNANSKFTNVISGGDYANQYLSIKVVYESAGNNWSLYVDSSSSGFPRSDPREAVTQIGFASDNAFTSNALSNLGILWNHATSANDSLIYDDVYVPSFLPTTINIKAVSEGYYNSVSGTLNTKDTMTAYLRNPVSPFQKVDSSKAVIDSLDFTGTFTFENVQSGSYYIELRSLNSIETWSKLPLGITAGSVNNYDFTASLDRAYGNNLILKDGNYCIFSGDVNQDGIVDLTDLLLIYNDAVDFSSGYFISDINGDRIVDLTDLLITYNNSAGFVSRIIPN
ncbi:MAG: endonuclease [Ignavibacteria bacterium]|nr:endonuclease [Ignavibacteria bacterium]